MCCTPLASNCTRDSLPHPQSGSRNQGIRHLVLQSPIRHNTSPNSPLNPDAWARVVRQFIVPAAQAPVSFAR